ncbi:Radical SAM domain protein [Solidesulfovibrio fructosivorans JJ]]|uniref:Radical SAM domain protein n=1 Tax=Solidesulfovibrio fructosivorans JJ] TaxID=596151 RepID=E1JXU6_SOLFR|nr:radical SAM protein [Solidesulfovibrio fructosivorans]EFL50869.1 Radical SAM domain protein [Solidesulfovibrio fructosivorans JJ]]
MGQLYSSMKIFHFKDKIDSTPAQQPIQAPIHLRIKPTNFCNHNCRYCAYRMDSLQLGKDMRIRDSIPHDKMREIVTDIIDMGVKAVTFSGGGEPFCYPYLLETVKRLHENGVKFASLSNGALLTGEIAEFFAANGHWLRVSMDGWSDDSYTELRGVKSGEFTKIMGNLEHFVRYNGFCRLGVSFIINAINHSHVPEILEQLRDRGVRSVKVTACVVSNQAEENRAYHAPFCQATVDAIHEATARLAGPDFEIFNDYPNHDTLFQKKYTWCPYQQILAVVAADLGVYSCQDKAYNLENGLLGSLREQSLKEFWFKDKKAFFRINPSRDCQHHCTANAKNLAIHDYLSVDRDHLEFV